jgi:hypothetical protein
MAGEEKYVFCIIEAGPQPAPSESGIHTIIYRDLAAVVRDSPLAPPKPTRQDLVGHLRVIEQAMGSSTVIPVEFGTIAASEEDVRENLLASRYEQLRALLAHLEDKVELGLKVLWKEMQPIFAEIVAEQEPIRALRQWIATRPEPHTRQQRIEVGRMVAEALAAKRYGEGEEILEALTPLSVESRAGQLLGEKMILNAAFLVERRREADFDQGVSRLAEERSQRLFFKYVGPAPPFNFVDLREPQEEGQ